MQKLWMLALVAAFLGSCATTSSELDALKAQNLASEGKMTQMSADMDQTKAHLAQLETLNNALAAQGLVDAQQLTALRAKLGELTKVNDALTANLDALKSGKTKAEATYLAQIDALNKDKAALQDKINDLEKQVMEASRQSQEVDQRLANLRSQLADQLARGNIDIKRYRQERRPATRIGRSVQTNP